VVPTRRGGAAHLIGTDTNTELSGLEPLIGVEELSEYLEVPVKTLYEWHQSGKGPAAGTPGTTPAVPDLRRPLVAGRTGRLVDVDELADAHDVAAMLGLSDATSVHLYQRRYPDMPRPVVDRGGRRARLWLRSEISEWDAARSREGT
jgi:predicted DNA-binding transcriptional regulator AlpA